MIENIVVGEPLVPLASLGIEPSENTDFVNDGPRFLPSLLVHVGLFKTTSEIHRINKQREHLIAKDPRLNLWREILEPEFTEFKIGKRHFWLVVGE